MRIAVIRLDYSRWSEKRFKLFRQYRTECGPAGINPVVDREARHNYFPTNLVLCQVLFDGFVLRGVGGGGGALRPPTPLKTSLTEH
jgi:hypothetical protein